MFDCETVHYHCISLVYNTYRIVLWILEPRAIFLKGSLQRAIERYKGYFHETSAYEMKS